MSPFRQRAVELVELAGHVSEALVVGFGPCPFSLALAVLRVLGEPGGFGACELRLLARAGRGCDCASGRRGFETHALEPGQCGDEDARRRQEWRTRRSVARGSHVHAVAQRTRDRRPAGQRLRTQEDELPVGQLLERTEHAAQQWAFARSPFEHDRVALLPRLERRRIDALADDAVLAGKTLRCRSRGLLARRDERVDPPEQAFALRPTGWIAQSFGVEEGRDGHGLRIS